MENIFLFYELWMIVFKIYGDTPWIPREDGYEPGILSVQDRG